MLHTLQYFGTVLSPAGFFAIAAEGLQKKKNIICVSASGVFGVKKAKARGEAPGLEDPGIASLPFEKEPENPARMKKNQL